MPSIFSKIKQIFTLITAIVTSLMGHAQPELPLPRADPAWLLSVQGGGAWPGGVLRQRFGTAAALGLGLSYQTARGWLWGVEGHFLFGDQVREDVLRGIATQDGFVFGRDGLVADIRIFQRGFMAPVAKVGRVWPLRLPGANANAGWWLAGGVGWLQHRILIQDITRSVDQLAGPYRRGYDRLTSGPALVQQLGYLYTGERRGLNFFVMIESTQGFTRNRRAFDFAAGRRLDEARLDWLLGVRLGWVVPIYRNAAEKERFYYF